MKRISQIILAALMAAFVICFSTVALAQPSAPPSSDDASLQECRAKLKTCDDKTASCDDLSAELSSIKADPDAWCKKNAPMFKGGSGTSTVAPKPTPLKLLCEEGTTGTPDTSTGHCVCDDPAKVLLTGKFGGNVKVEVCLLKSDQIKALMNIYVTKVDFQKAMDELRNGQMTRETVVAIIKETVPNLEPRVADLERRMTEAERKNDGQDWEINELKKGQRKRVHLRAGIGGDVGVRGQLASGSVFLTFGADAHITDSVGIWGMARGGLAFEENVSTMMEFGVVVAPIFYLSEHVSLYVGPAFTQHANFESRQDGLDGQFPGGTFGLEAGLPIQLGSSPLELTPFVGVGYGTIDYRSDAGKYTRANGIQVKPGLMLTIKGGVLDMGGKK